MKPVQEGFQKILQKIQSTGIAKYGNGNQHSHQVGDDSHRDGEAFFGSLDEFGINRYSPASCIQRKEGQQKWNGERREGVEKGGYRFKKTDRRSSAKLVRKGIREKEREEKQANSHQRPRCPRSHR